MDPIKCKSKPFDSKVTSLSDGQEEIFRPVLLPEEDGQQNREVLDPEDENQLQPLGCSNKLENIPYIILNFLIYVRVAVSFSELYS